METNEPIWASFDRVKVCREPMPMSQDETQFHAMDGRNETLFIATGRKLAAEAARFRIGDEFDIQGQYVRTGIVNVISIKPH